MNAFVRNLQVSFVLLFIAVVAGCHSQAALTPQQAEGKHLYASRCAHCHEDNDLALKKAPPDLHNLFNRASMPGATPLSDANVQTVVLNGKGMMPGFAGRFTQDQMNDLLSYLHTGLR